MQYKIVVDKQPMTNPSSEKKEYIIDIEELRVKGSTHDSLMFEIDKTYVIRRLKLSEYYVLSVLDEPIIEALESINIELFEGDNYIYLIDMQGNNFYAEYLIKNEFNDVFATRKEMNSAIDLTMQQITIAVNQKFTDYSTTEEMNAAIDLRANQINAEVEKKVDEETITGAYLILKINGDTSESKLNADKIELSANDVLNLLAGNTINLTSKNIAFSSTNFNVDKNGNMTCSNANISGTVTSNNANITGGSIKVGSNFEVNSSGNMTCSNGTFNGGKISLTGGTLDNARFYVIDSSDKNIYSAIAPDSIRSGSGSVYFTYNSGSLIIRNSLGHFQIYNGSSRIDTSFDDFYVIGDMHANSYNYDSLQSIKKNITKFNKNALNIVKEAELYEFNYRKENDTDKKHIGFVIGDEDEKYKTPVELISKSKDGIDAYSMVSVLWKAVQELSARVEQLEKEVHK